MALQTPSTSQNGVMKDGSPTKARKRLDYALNDPESYISTPMVDITSSDTRLLEENSPVMRKG